MKLIVSQNLLGYVEFTELGVSNVKRMDILANGIARHGNDLYIADWSDIYNVTTGEKIHVEGYSNIHTVNVYRNQLLVSSTENDRVFLGKEEIFKPSDFGFKGFQYVNAAIPYTDSLILIGMRNPKIMLIFDVDKRKIERAIRLPYLNNMHHPTPYFDDMFLVSDGDGVVLFDMNGRPIIKSQQMKWPRGIKVVDKYNVYIADRDSVYLWNPVQNRIVRKWHGPYTVYQDRKVNNDVVTAGAFFDLIVEK